VLRSVTICTRIEVVTVRAFVTEVVNRKLATSVAFDLFCCWLHQMPASTERSEFGKLCDSFWVIIACITRVGQSMHSIPTALLQHPLHSPSSLR